MVIDDQSTFDDSQLRNEMVNSEARIGTLTQPHIRRNSWTLRPNFTSGITNWLFKNTQFTSNYHHLFLKLQLAWFLSHWIGLWVSIRMTLNRVNRSSDVRGTAFFVKAHASCVPTVHRGPFWSLFKVELSPLLLVGSHHALCAPLVYRGPFQAF